MNLAVLRFDRTAALIDGRVGLKDVNIINAPGGGVNVNGFRGRTFDGADIPLSRYVFWKEQGLPITAIPVFTDRLFRYQYIYTRYDTGITKLADLRGKRVLSVASYFSTPAFWHRAMLSEECGIMPRDVIWHTAFPEPEGMRIPSDVSVTLTPASMLGLERLIDGTVDCLMAGRTAMVPTEAHGKIRRVLDDAYERDREWARREKFFPILHVFALWNDALEGRPGCVAELCRAFDESKQHAYRILQDERMTALPFMRGYLDDTVAVWGDDPWPYGLEANRPVLERFLGYAHDQGLTQRRLGLDELFTSEGAAYDFKSRMSPGCITGLMEGGWAAVPT